MDKYTGAAEWKPAASSADTSELDTAMGSLNVGASEWNPTTLASQAQEWVPPGAGAPNVGYGNTVASGGAYGGYGGYGGYGAGGAAYQQPAAMPMFPPQASQQFYAGQPAAWPAQQQADVDERDEHAMIQEELNKQFLREQSEWPCGRSCSRALPACLLRARRHLIHSPAPSRLQTSVRVVVSGLRR